MPLNNVQKLIYRQKHLIKLSTCIRKHCFFILSQSVSRWYEVDVCVCMCVRKPFAYNAEPGELDMNEKIGE